MKRKLMISDIHGCLEQLNELLEVAKYHCNEDQLILLGDYVDRGPRSRETVDRVMELVRHHGAIALKGNHDDRWVDFILNGGRRSKASFFSMAVWRHCRAMCLLKGKPETTVL